MRPSGLLLALLIALASALGDVTTTSGVPETSTKPSTTTNAPITTTLTASTTTPSTTTMDWDEYYQMREIESQRKNIKYVEDQKRILKEEKAAAHRDHGECFRGERRSPIKFETVDAVPVYYSPLEFVNYNLTGMVRKDHENNFTDSLIGFGDWGARPFIQGGGLRGRYNLAQIQVHSVSSHHHYYHMEPIGHTIDNLKHTAELHLIHSIDGKSFQEAAKVEGGIMAVVVLIDIQNPYQSRPKTNESEFRIQKSIFPSDTIDETRESVPPAALLPENTVKFYRYNGSMSRPPCNISVTYTILADAIEVSDAEFRYFSNGGYGITDRAMKHYHTIGRFVEEVAPRGNRTVLVNLGIPHSDVTITPIGDSGISTFFIALAASLAGLIVGIILSHFAKKKITKISFDNIAMDDTVFK